MSKTIKRKRQWELDTEAARRFFRFIAQRHGAYYARRVLGERPPWCDDEIVRNYFFTNVYRELDPGTRAIRATLPLAQCEDEAVFWALAYRLAFNEHSFYKLVSSGLMYLAEFRRNSPQVRRLLRSIDKPWTSAYVVSNYGRAGSKVDVITDVLMGIADKMQGRDGYPGHARLGGRAEWVQWCLDHLHGIGKFVAFQAMVDLCYPVGHGRGWLPWDNGGWVVAGPGAEKGLRILFPTEQVNQRTSNALVAMLCARQRGYLRGLGMRGWTATSGPVYIDRSNMQNCCCEFSKYERIRSGGKARRRFDPRSSRERDMEARGHGQQLEMT